MPMKNYLMLPAIMILALNLSCERIPDELKSLTNTGLNGKWNLVSVICDCDPSTTSYRKGEQVWYIDTLNSKLTVFVRNGTPEVQQGTYDIIIEREASKIEIASIRYDFWYRENDLFISYQAYVGGPNMRFVRD